MEHIISPCGIVCSRCPAFPKECPGCLEAKGRPSCSAGSEAGACPLYACCVQERGLEHCGLCSHLPCVRYRECSDPSASEAELQKALEERISVLQGRHAQ